MTPSRPDYSNQEKPSSADLLLRRAAVYDQIDATRTLAEQDFEHVPALAAQARYGRRSHSCLKKNGCELFDARPRWFKPHRVVERHTTS